MFSISIENNLIKKVELVDIKKLIPHEEVVVERKDALKNYLLSLSPDVIISSIIVCQKTNLIIDGHHRYTALMELGFKKIPVTKIEYDSKSIKAYFDDRIEKKEIIGLALKNKLLSPKSTKHVVLNLADNQWYPIILLSSLFHLSK